MLTFSSPYITVGSNPTTFFYNLEILGINLGTLTFKYLAEML